ncbi:MAG: TlpA family protein disulfide reductase [Chitinophagaceae bacterium]
MKKWIFFILGTCVLILEGIAQTPPFPDLSMALKTGDKVPDVTLENLLNYQNKEAKLSDFEGKLVILDFFATWCSSCVKGLPQLDALQKKRDDVKILVVTTEPKEKVKAFFEQNNLLKGLKLTVVTEDSTCQKLFPHRYIPHEVWISGNRMVKAITAAEYVTTEKIDQAIAGKEVSWVMKNDFFPFDHSKPLRHLLHTIYTAQGTAHYSGFTTYIAGPDFMKDGFSTDAVAGTTRFYVLNTPILTMYYKAFKEERLGFLKDPEKRKLLVKDTLQYLYDPAIHKYKKEWQRAHSFCYESVWPMGTPEAVIRKKLKDDLDQYFGLVGTIEVKDSSSMAKQFVLKETIISAKL